jgi:hypothetical protein
MTEGRAASATVEDYLDGELVDRVLGAAVEAPPGARIREAVEMSIEIAELDREGARAALWEMRADPATMERLESCLGMSPERATLALGAAIQLAGAELASQRPDLRGRTEELLRWLEGDW